MDPELEKENVEVDDAAGDIKATKLGLKRVQIALIASLVALIIGFITSLYLDHIFQSGNLEEIEKVRIIGAVSGFVQLGILIFYMIFLFLGIRSIRKGSGSFSREHKFNLDWAWKLLIGIAVLNGLGFIIPFISIFSAMWPRSISDPYLQIAITMGISRVIGSVLLIFWILLLISCIREIAHKRERDMIYLYGLGIIVNYFIMIPYFLFSYSPEIIADLLMKTSIFTSYLHIAISIAVTVFAILAYAGTRKRMKLKDESDLREGGFLGRPTALTRYTTIGLGEPIRLIAIFLLAGLIIGGVNAYQFNSWINDPFDHIERDGILDLLTSSNAPMVEIEDVLIEELTFTDTAMEGEAIQIDINDLGPIIFVHAELRWTDEGDIRMKENEPDRFELGIVMNLDVFEGVQSYETGENPKGGEGQIECEVPYDEGYAHNYANASVTVLLIEAGDLHRTVGPEV
ncbi:MAG: hypothetical protein KAH57_04195, partial [Thermoplasmata archaeon]|nr:hypothetical protein [Thermoplasmata archaeon]